jgi:hypothetical protein
MPTADGHQQKADRNRQFPDRIERSVAAHSKAAGKSK